MKANILIHNKNIAKKICSLKEMDNILYGLPDFVFGEAFEATLDYDKYGCYTWIAKDEDGGVDWLVPAEIVERVEIIEED